jgi:hypothetical protein
MGWIQERVEDPFHARQSMHQQASGILFAAEERALIEQDL